MVLGLFFMLLSLVCHSETYAVLDKSTNNPLGVTDVSNKSLSSWEKIYKMIPVDESYRGKQPYEIKYDGGIIRKSTPDEISVYKTQKENSVKEAKKQKVLDELGITAEDLDKIKSK